MNDEYLGCTWCIRTSCDNCTLYGHGSFEQPEEKQEQEEEE